MRTISAKAFHEVETLIMDYPQCQCGAAAWVLDVRVAGGLGMVCRVCDREEAIAKVVSLDTEEELVAAGLRGEL